MKAELRLEHHTQQKGAMVIEVWWQGRLVATVVGADGPGVRVISKFQLSFEDKSQGPLTCYEIKAGG